MPDSEGIDASDVPSSGIEEKLRKKVEEQASQISQYQSHVIWASGYARKCEERTRAVDPLASISVSGGKGVCF